MTKSSSATAGGARKIFHCVGALVIPTGTVPYGGGTETSWMMPVVRSGEFRYPPLENDPRTYAYPLDMRERIKHRDEPSFGVSVIDGYGIRLDNTDPGDAPSSSPDTRTLWLTTVGSYWPKGRHYGRVFYDLQRMIADPGPLVAAGGLPVDGYAGMNNVDIITTAYSASDRYIGFRVVVESVSAEGFIGKLVYRDYPDEDETTTYSISISFSETDTSDIDLVFPQPRGDYRINVSTRIEVGLCQVLLSTNRLLKIVADTNDQRLLAGPKIPFYLGALIPPA